MTHTFWRRSGSGNSIFLSRRPGRRRAGSKVSCLLVAMITLTFTDWSKPSIWFKSSRRIRWTSRSAPVWASKRFVAIASISSMKIIEGEFSYKVFKPTVIGWGFQGWVKKKVDGPRRWKWSVSEEEKWPKKIIGLGISNWTVHLRKYDHTPMSHSLWVISYDS